MGERKAERTGPVRLRLRVRARGQSMTEFALIAPLLFLVLFAIVQFGVLMLTKSALTYATREGARVASIHGSEPNANDQICAALRNGLVSSGINPNNLGTVLIFKATAITGTGPMTITNDNPSAHDVGNCNGSNGTWQYTGVATYPYYARNAVDPPDPIGVSLTYNFQFLIPMFGNGLSLADSTILRVEPLYAMGSSSVILPPPYPTFTATPYPTYTPYPPPTACPTGTPYPTFTATETPGGATDTPTNTPTNTPVGASTPTPQPGGC